jgi:CDP-6-deoxy-D-xylo-4-hexulose-3-dehydrase
MKPIKLVSDPVDREDINALCEWLQQDPIPQLSKGSMTLAFEQKWADAVGRSYSVFVNSGSSANFLMFDCLKITGRLVTGDKIVCQSICWITSISPIVQLGMTPILCDINLHDLSADLDSLEAIFKKEKPKAFLLVPILGLVPDMQEVVELCAKHGVVLLIDNCESAGSKFNGRFLEDYGLMCSSSHYVGHQINCIEGGSISTDDKDLYETLKMLRSHGWTRDTSHETKKFYREKYNLAKFTELYSFIYPAYNLRSTDLNAFIGIRHVAKMDEIIGARNKNFHLYNELLQNDYWKPVQNESCFVSNLGYPVIHPKRDEIVEALRGNNVEVRPLVSGNMGLQPYWINLYGKQPLKNADMITSEGCYLPNHDKLTESEIEFVCNIVNRVINS